MNKSDVVGRQDEHCGTNQRIIKAALIDLSGTLYIGDNAIPGAVQACEKLKQMMSVKFLTNTSKVSSRELSRKLKEIGFQLSREDIMTSTGAAQDFLVKHELRPLCLVEPDVLEGGDLDGIDLCTNTNSRHDPNCVLVGLAPSAFCYNRLNQAFRLLLELNNNNNNSTNNKDNKGVDTSTIGPLLAIHRANYFRDDDDELSLGPGGFVTCLETAANVQATVIGKPNNVFFETAIASLKVEASQTVMVGDDIVQDMEGAMNAGVGTCILVRTGKYREGDEEKLMQQFNGSGCESRLVVVDSIVEAVDYIQEHV